MPNVDSIPTPDTGRTGFISTSDSERSRDPEIGLYVVVSRGVDDVLQVVPGFDGGVGRALPVRLHLVPALAACTLVPALLPEVVHVPGHIAVEVLQAAETGPNVLGALLQGVGPDVDVGHSSFLPVLSSQRLVLDGI